MKQRYKQVYSAQQLPIFQNRMFRTRDEAINSVKGDVELVQDLETGLIFNQAFKPELMEYDVDYQNEQAVSLVFQEHLSKVAKIVERHFSGYSLIEVGCGKGHFLEQLQAAGFDITGLDPTYEGSNASIIKEFFTSATGIEADGIVLRHVLEHVQSPVDFLFELLTANGGSGKIYIEVPCFDWICNHRAWFDIFYEHVNYFSLADFYRMFEVVFEAGYTFNGQYLFVVADLSTIRKPVFNSLEAIDFPRTFLDTVALYAADLRARQNDPNTMSAIWGGASKGVIFALYMMRAGAEIDFVIDINEAKQGKFLAVTGLRVWSPEEAMTQLSPGTNIYVMNANYLNEIREITGTGFNLIAIE